MHDGKRLSSPDAVAVPHSAILTGVKLTSVKELAREPDRLDAVAVARKFRIASGLLATHARHTVRSIASMWQCEHPPRTARFLLLLAVLVGD